MTKDGRIGSYHHYHYHYHYHYNIANMSKDGRIWFDCIEQTDIYAGNWQKTWDLPHKLHQQNHIG